MSTARLHYKQTTDERYDERTNAAVREMILSLRVKIEWEEGGTGFSDDPTEMVAENEFEIYGERDAIKLVHKTLESWLARPVTLTWINPWYHVRTYLRWHLKTKWQVKWAIRKRSPEELTENLTQGVFGDLPEDDFDWPENFYELSQEEQAQVIANYEKIKDGQSHD